MAYRVELPYGDNCKGYDAPRPGGRRKTYYADPKNPGSVVMDNPRDIAIAREALKGAYIREEGTRYGYGDVIMPDGFVCGSCKFNNWGWVHECSRCGVHRGSGRAA